MKKLVLLPALALFWNTAALAQGCGRGNGNCIVPDRPNNDATEAAANTKFVQNAIGGGGGVPQNANTVHGWPDQRRPSGRVIPRPGRRRSAGAIYGPRSSDHQHIESTQPNPIYVPFRDATIANGDPMWRTAPAR